MSCIFCRIVAGEIPSHTIAQNEGAFAFLDIQPLARGHILVIPKEHAERYADMSEASARDVATLAQEIARRLTTKLGAAGLTIAFNDGRAAGQEVPHVHAHIVPRATGDGAGPVHALFRERPKLTPDELKALAASLV